MRQSAHAKRVLRLLYRSGRLATLERHELRLYLVMLSSMSDPGHPRRWRLTALQQALGLSVTALNRAAAGLERRGWVRIVRTSRTWAIELKVIGERR